MTTVFGLLIELGSGGVCEAEPEVGLANEAHQIIPELFLNMGIRYILSYGRN